MCYRFRKVIKRIGTFNKYKKRSGVKIGFWSRIFYVKRKENRGFWCKESIFGTTNWKSDVVASGSDVVKITLAAGILFFQFRLSISVMMFRRTRLNRKIF